MLRYIPLLLVWLSCLSLSAQITLKIGDEAPKITPTEYLLNEKSKSKLKGKFLVLTLCKNWDQPCFNDLPHLDSLRTALSNDQVVFLALFRGNPGPARKDIDGDDFNISLATDLSGSTQIRYGDGETGLVGWPLTFLIDDQNVVRWQGDSDDLTVEHLERFITGQHSVIDRTGKYTPLDPGDFLFEPMTIKELVELEEADSVDSFVRVWDKDEFVDGPYNSFFSSTYHMGIYGPETLENIFQSLFPKKRLIIPGNLMEKEYRVAFIQRSVDRETSDHIAASIIAEIGLQATSSSSPATYYSIEVANQQKLDQPRKVSIRNRLPKGMKDIGGYSDKDLHNFEIRSYDLAGLAKLLNKYSPDRWSYKGRNRKTYNFVLDLSSTKALLKSLARHGIKADGKAGTVDELSLERIR